MVVNDSKNNNGSEIKLQPKKNMRRLSFKEARELKELDVKLPLLEEQKIYLEEKVIVS
mgnify:CR=1 FL=1